MLSAALLLGCVATQHDVLQMESQMDELNASLTNMQKNQADLAVKMDTLSSSLSSFTENLKDFGDQVSRLSAKIDDLETALGQKVTALGQTIKKQQEEVETAMLPSKTYHDSYVNLGRKKYDLAAQGFQLYLEKFPDGEMAENAYYNLGEAQAGRGKWQEAAVAYATILDKFRDSQQTAAVRLKYANALLKTPGDNTEEASRYLKSVIQDYPKTPQARLAKELLQSMEPKLKNPKPAARKAQREETKKSTSTPRQR